MSLDSLQKICEDNANEMEQATVDGNTPILECILPKLFPFFSHSTPRIQISALSTANHFIQLKSPSFVKHIQSYLKELFAIASLDMDSLVCKEVCHSFVMLLEHFTQQLLPYIGQLTQYMIHCNQSESTQVALEACDFWFQFSRLERYQEQLVPLLPDIIPVILKSLVYTDEDILALGRDEESDSKVHPQVNRPRHKQLYYKYALAHANHDDDEEDDEDEDVEDDEFFSEWTLRKFSATSLEALTSTFRSHVTNVLLPLLNHTLFSQDWKVVESSILALGAVAEGKKKKKKIKMFDLTAFFFFFFF
jgi:hypothetical protein